MKCNVHLTTPVQFCSSSAPLHTEPLTVVGPESTGLSPPGTRGPLSAVSSPVLALLWPRAFPEDLKGVSSGRSWRTGPGPGRSGQGLSPRSSGTLATPPLHACSGPAQRQVGEAWTTPRSLSQEPQCQGPVTGEPRRARMGSTTHVQARSLQAGGNAGRCKSTTASALCACICPVALRKGPLNGQRTQALGQRLICAPSTARVQRLVTLSQVCFAHIAPMPCTPHPAAPAHHP